jgi:hypothetical protein
MIALYNSRTKRFNGELTHQVNLSVTVRTVRTVQVQEEGFPLIIFTIIPCQKNLMMIAVMHLVSGEQCPSSMRY